MKRIIFAILILSCIYISGCCSIPSVADYGELYSFTRVEKKIKFGFSKKKVVEIKDFRQNERYDEDITALKERIEEYITKRADLSGSQKNRLRELKVTAGSLKEETNLLLGKPDKIKKVRDKAGATSEIWIYRINKRSIFTIVIIPVFFTHEAYYLYFKDNVLITIERHYLKQTVETTDPGLGIRKEKESS